MVENSFYGVEMDFNISTKYDWELTLRSMNELFHFHKIFLRAIPVDLRTINVCPVCAYHRFPDSLAA